MSPGARRHPASRTSVDAPIVMRSYGGYKGGPRSGCYISDNGRVVGLFFA